MFMFFSFLGMAQTVTIGSGTNTGSKLPISTYYGYSYSQQIVLKSEINNAGNITKLRFYSTGTSLSNSNNWTIYMGHTTKTAFASNADWILAGAMTQVFSGTVTATPAAGWMEITLSTPFVYNNVDNLVVSVDENTSGDNGSSNSFRIWTTPITNRAIYYQSDTVNPDPATITLTGTRTSYISQMQLVIPSTTAPNCAISHSPVNTATGVARNATLSWADGGGGPISYDVYFGTTTSPALVGNQTGTSYNQGVLAANTQYFWRVVPKNANGDAVGGCIERSFTTGTDLAYCTPSSTSSSTYINNFSTTLGTTNVSNLTSGYTTGGYQNNYATQTVTSYATGSFNYNFTVVGGTLGAAIWIDWNLNGVFDDTTEKVFVTTGYGSGPYSGTIVVPSGTAQGDYRMRVMVDYNSSIPTNPCMTTNTRTETEDYKITVGTPPSCLAPTALTATNITGNSVDVSWTASTSSPLVGYEFAVTTSATPPASGTAVSGTSASVSTLSSSTTYYLHVRSECVAGTDYSGWATSASFTTACSTGTVPYTMPIASVTVPALPLCTTVENVNADANTWRSYVPTTGITGNVMGYPYNSSNAANDWLYTNNLALTAGTSYRVKFKFKDTSYAEKLKVAIGTSAVNTAMTTTLYDVTTGTSGTVISQVIDFTVPTSGNYNLGFQCYSIANQNTLYLGEISVELTPTCFVPTALTVSGTTATTANVSWTAPASGTTPIGYQYAVTTSATPPASGTAVSGTSATVSTLSASTTYYLHVRSECVSGVDYSTWVTSTAFVTPCLAISTLPWNEGFENAGAIPTCWNQSSTNTENWLFGTGTTFDYGATTDHTTGTGYFAWIDDSTPDNANPSGIESPAFDFTGVGNPEMTFWFQNFKTSTVATAPASSLYVDVFNGTTWINSVFSIVNTKVTAWTQYTVNLSAYISANTRVRFRATEVVGNYQSDISLDDIQIYAAPTDTPDFVNLQFPASATILAGGSATVYGKVYEAGLTDTTTSQAAGIVALVGISPVGSNTNPNTWTTWVPTTWNPASGVTNDDEYQANIGSTLVAGTYYYATRFQLNGGPFRYGGTDGTNGNFWDGTTYNSGVLTVNANPTQCATVVSPANAATNTQINGGGVLISWTAPTSGPAPTSYDVYHGTTSGTLTLLGNLPAPATAVNITGLAFNTQYFWRIVPKSAAGGDATGCSEWSYTTQANPFAAYCASVPTSNDGSGVTNVNLGGVNHQTFDVTYAIQNTPVALTAGAVSNFSVTFATGFTYDTHVWIDFDNNNVFDTSEKVYTGVSTGTNPTTLNGTFTIPAGVLTGQYKMRIGTADSGQATPDPCYSGSYGITLDFLANVTGLCSSMATWDGSTWTGTPSATAALVFNGNYSGTTTLDGCSCTINGTSTVNFTAGTLNLQNHLVIASGASLILESGANLVQVNSTIANSVLGTFTAKRNSADMVRLDYTNWSSPVVGQNALAFSPATVATRFYSYDPLGTTAAGTTGSYSVIDPSTTSFTAGNGLLVRAPNNWSSTIASAYPGEFTGVPHNGNYSVSIANNPANTTSVPANIGFNLLGNPYASPIDADAYLAANTGAGVTALYFWTHTEAANASGNYATSNYASFNSLGGTAAAAGGLTPDGIIQVGQGFLANTNTGGTAVFNNGMRLASSNGQFFKTSGQLNQATTVEKHRMWFDLNSPGNNHNQILVGYIQGATNGLDASFDANLFTETSSALYSSLSNGKFVIQGRALPFVSSDSVPLGLLAQTAGQYTITLSNFDGLFSGQDVYLRDNLLNVTHDIKDSAYTFASAAGEFDSRFEIVYAAPLSVQTPTFTENSVVVYSDQSGININAGQTVIDNVKIFDVRGRQLMSKSNINESSILLENSIANNQVLIIQISTLDNQTISKKIVN